MSESYKDLDKKILGEVYSSNETMDNLIVLCDEFKSRWPGSGNDRKACEYMVKKLEEYGLENCHMESFTFPGWLRETSKLKVTSPINRDIPCIALPGSIEGEVEADLVFLGDGSFDIYDKRREDIEGNIVMVTSRNPIEIKKLLHRSEKYKMSILAGAAGWIFVNHYPAYGPATGSVSPIIPAVGISYENGQYLARSLRGNRKVKINLKTKCKNLDVETFNVVADLPGTHNDKDTVVYGAHYDGHDISVGALDDATGAVCVMEIARVLTKEKRHIKRPMRFILFAAEELGVHGGHAYVDQHIDEIKNIRFMLNFDMAGRSGRQGFNLNGIPELENFFNEIVNAIGLDIPIWHDISFRSDHWPFQLKGVPTALMGEPEFFSKMGGRGFGHTIYDTVDKTDIRAQRECVANAALAAIRILNTDNWPARHRTKKEIDAIVNTRAHTSLKDYLLKNMDNLRPETKLYAKKLLSKEREDT